MSPTDPTTTRIQSVVPTAHVMELEKIASKDTRTLSGLVALIIAEWLQRRRDVLEGES